MTGIKDRDQGILVLFTNSYPYDGAAEQTFLNPEVKHLISNFDKIHIVPEARLGRRLPLPKEIQVEEGYAAEFDSPKGRMRIILRALFSSLFYREIFKRPRIFLRLKMLKKLLSWTGSAVWTRRWAKKFIKNIDGSPAWPIFYTYWLGASSLGLGLLKKNFREVVLVSRTHGYDLYEERFDPPYAPFRSRTIKALDGLFPDSEMGRTYILNRYARAVTFCETARLGVPDPAFETPPSRDGVFRIVSCSFIVPVKRIELLSEGILHAASRRPGQRFEWHHFGNGPLRQALQDEAIKTFPENAKAHFPGYSSFGDLMQFYKSHAIDVFMNVSASEGTPVAIMEAISCHIPIAATAVGGNPEIVTERNGKLMSPNPTPDEIAETFFFFLDHPELSAAMRRGSRKVWKDHYDAERNYGDFAHQMKRLRASRSAG